MTQFFATVSSKGQLVIPAPIRDALGIGPGTRVTLRQDGEDVILTPVVRRTARDLIQKLAGMTAGGPSMADELIADRRSEDQRADW